MFVYDVQRKSPITPQEEELLAEVLLR